MAMSSSTATASSWVEQVGVGVQRHRRLGVSEHPLHRFDIRARADGQRRRRVSQIVWGDRRKRLVCRRSDDDEPLYLWGAVRACEPNSGRSTADVRHQIRYDRSPRLEIL
jgi:hypothetical protein